MTFSSPHRNSADHWNALRALAEKATPSLHASTSAFNIHDVNAYRAATNPATILRLLDELEAARRVVEATRKYLGWGSINNADAVGKALAAYGAAVAKSRSSDDLGETP